MINFDIVIGIEIHVVVNTTTKMFSPAKNSHKDPANTNIHPIDLAFPGTMPSVNKQVIVKALQLAAGLHMDKIDLNVRFDRKNYFYQDLPKGFQITQHYFPIAQHGFIEIVGENSQKKHALIERFHIEEDTAKQIRLNEHVILLDYNRSGSPLFEIVTAPTFSNATEVKSYLVNLRRILLALDVSDCRMEDGSMRVDVNISVRPVGAKKFGPKVEIKNINSISNITKAINFEVHRQIKMCLLNQEIIQQTRYFDDKNDVTVFMRTKENLVDYRYMTEPNICSIQLSQHFLDTALAKLPLLPEQTIKIFQNQQLNQEFIDLLLDNPNYQLFLNLIDESVHQLSESAKWFFVELIGYLKKNNQNLNSLDLSVFKEIGIMINELHKQKINSKQAKKILQELVKANGSKSSNELIKEFGYEQIFDEKLIEKDLQTLLDANSSRLTEYAQRPQRVEKFFIGLLMKKTGGAINPQISIQILRRLVQERINQ